MSRSGRARAWLRAMWLPALLGFNVTWIFGSQVPVEYGAPPDVRAWGLGIAATLMVAVIAWAGWRVVQREAGGLWCAASAGPALLCMVLLALLPVTAAWRWASGPPPPDPYYVPDDPMLIVENLGVVFLVCITSPFVSALGGVFARRAQLEAEAD